MKRFVKAGLLVLFLLTFSTPTLAAPQNWEPIYPDAPNIYLDTNSVVKAPAGDIIFFVEKTNFSAPYFRNHAFELETIAYSPRTSQWRRHNHAYLDINHRFLEKYEYSLQASPWTKVSPNNAAIKRVMEILSNENPTNSQPSNMQMSGLPATWNGLNLTNSVVVPSKLSLDIDLATNAVFRGVIIKQPQTTVSDNGTLTFYLNNGDYAGIMFFQDEIRFWFSWDGLQRFDTANWNHNGLHKSSYYTSSIGFYTTGDGILYIDVMPFDNSLPTKSYKIKLPEGAQFFTGRCRENVLTGVVGLYQ